MPVPASPDEGRLSSIIRSGTNQNGALAPGVVMGDMGQRDARGYRLQSIDLVRGIAIVIMALDHTRDFFSNAHFNLFDPAQMPLALFLTRWVTHICAPTFVFLAGVSAGLMAERKTTSEISLFLCKRGLWLILIELFVITFAWTFADLGRADAGGGAVFSFPASF